jgi:hypothetical protein
MRSIAKVDVTDLAFLIEQANFTLSSFKKLVELRKSILMVHTKNRLLVLAVMSDQYVDIVRDFSQEALNVIIGKIWAITGHKTNPMSA